MHRPTLVDLVEQATATGRGVTFVAEDRAPERVTWAELHDEARRTAGRLQARGVAPGDRVALLALSSRSLVTTIQALWLAGATAVVLPLPLRLGSVEEFLRQTRARLAAAHVSLVVLDDELAAFFAPAANDPPTVMLAAITAGPPATFSEPAVAPGDLALLQFTSGSTAEPKGVMLPHSLLSTHIASITAAANFDPDEDVVVSWLPLYHDMGLIGMLTTPMATGCELVLGRPQDFMARPASWLEWMSEHRGSVSAGPNFSYALATRALRRASDLDLSRWRIALNGAEPVQPGAVEEFSAAARPFGFDARAIFCAFGMAETTLASTFPVPGSGMATDKVLRRSLEDDRVAEPAGPGDPPCDVRRLARLGTAIPGLQIRIVDPTTRVPLDEHQAGEIEVRGTSVMPGYYANPEATTQAISADGWLATGDLGYVVEGELVACGRLKDVIIVGGRNVFPEDIEVAAGAVPGVRAGNVIAFGIEGRKGRERLVVVAETREPEPAPLKDLVAKSVRHAVGLPAGDVVLVTPGTLPKTSSGKLQRSLCRARYLADELQAV